MAMIFSFFNFDNSEILQDQRILFKFSLPSMQYSQVGGADITERTKVSPQKTLCTTPGCSFKGYKELQNLCPDCYQERYDVRPPAEYPLV